MLVNRSFYRVFVINLLFCAFAHAQEQPSTKVSPRVPSAGKTGIRPPFTPVYPPDIQPAFRNLPYANKSSSQVLDLFIPAGSGPFPLVINIHGGGFMMGSKEMLDGPVARALLKSGVAVASLNYRLSGEARFPAAVQDVKAAVRYLRANARRFGIDGKRFLAFGQSAGGNLASMLGTSAHVREFDDPALGNMEQSSSVMGVIDWFGPTDFLKMDMQAKLQGCDKSSQSHGRVESPESKYLGCEPYKCPELAARANPIRYIGRETPPFLLQKGARDCVVPVGQSRLLYDKLKAANVSVSFDLLPNTGHGDRRGGKPVFLAQENIKRVVDFVLATLKVTTQDK